ncbi:MAG: NUDIX domain-containing protein [Candidatus Rokubacteria bacterium]|nr:NUDIX domain-containing protein [Candidatus Rokubacteria bacterium]
MSGAGGERSPVVARDAATVILTRDTPAGVEVLLLERHRRSRMAPGAFAFPGGRVEAHDGGEAWGRLCRGLTGAEASSLLPDVRPPARAIGFWIAALREAFEETGLLLAYDRRGAPFVPDTVGRERLAEYRARCHGDGRAFGAMLVQEALVLATDRMAYWAHWITPEERPVRYDTRFFVAAALAGATPEPDGVEVVRARWLTPAAALAQHRAGEIALVFVTQRILTSLGAPPTVGALLEAARSREIRPIRPRIVLADGQERFLLPGDPGYF